MIAVEVEDVTQQTNTDVGPLPGRDEFEVSLTHESLRERPRLFRNEPHYGGTEHVVHLLVVYQLSQLSFSLRHLLLVCFDSCVVTCIKSDLSLVYPGLQVSLHLFEIRSRAEQLLPVSPTPDHQLWVHQQEVQKLLTGVRFRSWPPVHLTYVAAPPRQSEIDRHVGLLCTWFFFELHGDFVP